MIDGTYYHELILTHDCTDQKNIAFKLKEKLSAFDYDENLFKFDKELSPINLYNNGVEAVLADNAYNCSIKTSVHKRIDIKKEECFKDRSRKFKKEKTKVDIKECLNLAEKIFQKYGFHTINKSSKRVVVEKKEYNNMFIVLEFQFLLDKYIDLTGRLKSYYDINYLYAFSIGTIQTKSHFNNYIFNEEDDYDNEYLHFSKEEELTLILEIFLNEQYPNTLKYFEFNIDHGYVNDNYLGAEYLEKAEIFGKE